MNRTRKHPRKQLDLDPVDASKHTPSYDAKDYDDETKIMIMLEASQRGLQATSEKYGTQPETILAWRERLHIDEDFAYAYYSKDHEIRNDFERETAQAIKDSLDFISRAAKACDVTNPQQIRAVAGALKMAAEFRLASEITYARLGKKQNPRELPPPSNNGSQDSYNIEYKKLREINEEAGVESVIEGEYTDE